MFSACIPPSDIQVTNIVTRLVNSFHLKSLPNLQMLFTVTLIIINSIYEGGIHLEIFRISFHTFRCESHAGSFVTILCARAKQEEPYSRVPFKMLMEVLPACLDPHLSKWKLFIKHFKDNTLICRNLAFHDGPMQFCNVTDRCCIIRITLGSKACLTVSTDCNVKYIGVTRHNNSLPYRMEFYFTSPLL